MNRYKLLIAGLLVLAGAVLVVTLRPAKPVRDAADGAVAPQDTQSGSLVQATKPAAPTKNQQHTKTGGTASHATESLPAANGGAGGTDASEPKTAREKAVEAWVTLVDQLVEQKDASPQEQAARVKEAFDKLDTDDQMDGIHRSLNLLPDEQFPALYGILFDKAESAEVLDAIFSDALNRPEELKNPLMKELVKDKTHPCYFESARILDVIGELEPKSEPTASP